MLSVQRATYKRLQVTMLSVQQATYKKYWQLYYCQRDPIISIKMMFGPILGESVYCWKTRPLGRPPPSPNRGIYPEYSILEISLQEIHIFR